MIIDLHAHTSPASDDSFLEPIQLIHRAKQVGLDAVCLTEHDCFWDKNELARLSQKHDFLLLPGVEIDTEEGHILVFGLEEYSLGMDQPEYLRRIVDKAGGVMILAHPYRGQSHNDEELRTAVEQYCAEPVSRLVDAIEVLNGRGSERQNRFSQEVCRKLGLKGIGGSDAHSFSDMPSCATLFERSISNVEELIAELKAGRFRAVNLNPGS
ncbi:CehA/McbA family metallohydrolase, partial [Chloroflexota bacterium]